MDEYVNIIWYDENPSKQTEDILSTIHYRVFLCTNIENLQKTINEDIHDTEKILLVLSGQMDHEVLLSSVHHERRIVLIFILADISRVSLEAYTKVCGTFSDYNVLEKKLLAQARILNHQAVAFHFDENLSEKSVEELLQNPETVLFDSHSRFATDRFVTPAEKEKLLRYCRRRYASNSTQLRLIDEFERQYESSRAIQWYSKDCFLFSSLNKCMRKQSGYVYDCDMVYFAVDLSTQIQLEWKRQREEENDLLNLFHVYRGASLPEAEIIRIQNYRGKSITSKGFLSTTKSIAVAKIFANNVIFDIEIDPKLKNIIYADISIYSHIPDEEEILIDFGTSFRIVDVILDPADNFWTVQLTSINEMDKVIDSYIDLKKSQNDGSVIIATGLVFFGHKERACQLLRDSLNSSNDNLEKMELNCELGEIHAQFGEFILAADYLHEAHRLCSSFFPYSLRLYSMSFWQAIMYACANKYDQVVEHFAIDLDFPDPQPYSIQVMYSNSWTYLVTNEKSLRFDPYRLAYEHLEQCLNIYEQDKDISCKIHFCLSLILLKCNTDDVATDFLNKSLSHLKMSGCLQSLKSRDHLILYYYYMGVIHESMKCYNKAKRYYRKIFHILHRDSNQNKNLIIIHVRIGTCYAAQKIYTIAIQQYEIALKHSLAMNESILSNKIRAHLGITYFKTNRYHEAIEQFMAIVELLGVYPRQFIQEIYLIIAETLLKIDDVPNAVNYYSKFLDWFEDIKSDCELWCDTCEHIIRLYLSENSFDLSLKYAKKMLEFRTKNCSDLDEIKDAQILIAFSFQKNNESQEAINYYKMAYDSLDKMASDISIEESNPMISETAVFIQAMLSLLYQTINDYDQAIYHANIALETEEKRFSRNKITIASCCDTIGWCHYRKGEYDKALKICTRGLHILHTSASPSEFDIQRCKIHHTLGSIWLGLGDLKQSFVYCTKGITILNDNPNLVDKNALLDEFLLLLYYIRKREDNTSCTVSTDVLQSESSFNTTDAQNVLVSQPDSVKDIEEQPYSPSEYNINIMLTALSIQIIGNPDTNSTLHRIQIQETESLLFLLYPTLKIIK